MPLEESIYQIEVDASVFGKDIGDRVTKGEVLGRLRGKDVSAPCDGIVKMVAFDSDSHHLTITILATMPDPEDD